MPEVALFCGSRNWQDRESIRRDIAALPTTVCYAYPLGESRGTRDMMARVIKAGIPLYVRGGPSSA